MRELSITSLLRAVTIALSTGMRYSEIKIDPSKPINSWKEGWESAKKTAGVICRFHDLRHTAVTRMLEGAIALPVVASILGWSAATTVRMVKRYGHIGHTAQRQAVALLEHVSAPTPASIEARREVASHCKWLILNGSPHWTISATGSSVRLREPIRSRQGSPLSLQEPIPKGLRLQPVCQVLQPG